MSENMFLTLNDLDIIAVEVYHSQHGSFLKSFADAWCRADPGNKRILRAAWQTLITKYKLYDEYKSTLEEKWNEYEERI